jgi:hypothetical protein
LDLKKAMLNGDRGTVISIKRAKNQETGKLEPVATITRTNAKWDPNNFHLNLLQNTKPLLDNTNTPRAAKKAITLERCFDRDLWVYNKSGLGNFAEAAKDAKRGKQVGKMIRKKKRQQRSGKGSRSFTRSPGASGYNSK